MNRYFDFKDIVDFLKTKDIIEYKIVVNKFTFEFQSYKFIIIANHSEDFYGIFDEYTIYFAGDVNGLLNLKSTISFLDMVITLIVKKKI